MDPTHVPDEWRIPDELWEVLELFLPAHVNTHPYGGGRPRTPDRVCAQAIFFVLRTGCQWKALDATKFCPGSTAHDRFQEWVEAGVFLEWWNQGLLDYDCLDGIDWSWLSMDGCMTKAPLGGEKDRQKPHGPSEKGGQAQPAGRGVRRAGRLGRGRRQSSRPENGPRDHRQHSGGASRADRRRAAAYVPG
jgi:putative transposase